MRSRPAPCAKCPWTQPGRPDITPEVEAAARDGKWFCCHVNMGTCFGAKAVSDRASRAAARLHYSFLRGWHA